MLKWPPQEKDLTFSELGKLTELASRTVGSKNILGHYNNHGKIVPYTTPEIYGLLTHSSTSTAKKFLSKMLKMEIVIFDGMKYSIPFGFCKMVNGYNLGIAINNLCKDMMNRMEN